MGAGIDVIEHLCWHYGLKILTINVKSAHTAA
jgi:hypothetical protein